MTHAQRSNHVHFVVIRISDSSAIGDLKKKVKETGRMYPAMPGASQLVELGASPLIDPSKVGGTKINSMGFSAVVFRVPGTRTVTLMALGSATVANLGEDDNAFVTLLKETLCARRVGTLWVADFARLLRSIDYLSHTWKAVRTNCRVIRHGAAAIDMSSPSAEHQFIFEALSASADARHVVSRTTRGKMRTYDNGKCPLAAHHVPMGYERTRKRTLRLDANAQRVVREIVRVLGDSTLTNRERVQQVADLGVASPYLTRQYGKRTSLATVRAPNRVVARWYELLDVWRTGRWVVDYAIPALLDTTEFDFPGLDIRVCATGGRTWRMTFDLPLPDGGWATADEFDAALRQRDVRLEGLAARGGAATGGVRKPFCGMPSWIHGEHQYTLQSHRAGFYELRRRPAKDAREQRLYAGEWRWVNRGWGRTPDKEGEVLGVIEAAALHHDVAMGLVDAATAGMQLQMAPDVLLASDDELKDEMRTELATLRRRARNANKNANDADTDRDRQDFLRDAREARDAAAELEADLLRLAGAAAGRFPVDADTIAQVLAAVADQTDHVPREVADALGTVVDGFRLIPAVTPGTVRWEACLAVPLAGGTLKIGPTGGTATLGTLRTKARRRNRSLAARATHAAELLMAEGLAVEEVAAKLEIRTERRVAQAIRDDLASRGLSSAAVSELVAATPPSARRAIWEHLHARPYPADLDPRFCRHVVDVYTTGDFNAVHARAHHTERMNGVLDFVLARGGWISPEDLPEMLAGFEISESTLGDYIAGRHRRGHWSAPILAAKQDGVSLIPCPHGDGGWMDIVALHPEVTGRLLCSRCRRTVDPAKKKLVFPEDYT